MRKQLWEWIERPNGGMTVVWIYEFPELTTHLPNVVERRMRQLWARLVSQ